MQLVLCFLLIAYFRGATIRADANPLSEWHSYYDWCSEVRQHPDRKVSNCYCPAKTKDLPYYFLTIRKTDAPQTIQNRYVCDANNDCRDGSDEKDCLCSPDQYQCGCPLRTQHCYHGQGCYSESDICNGRLDCMDGTDELNCTCPSGTFRCACQDNNTCAYPEVCILEHQTCDGKSDCSDGSDEADCQCAGEFSCGCRYVNGKCQEPTSCIPLSSKCDGTNDCADGSDEVECNFAMIQFYCACAKNGSCDSHFPTSVPWKNVCNLRDDCGDWSDEVNCPCAAGEYRCDCNAEGCGFSAGCVSYRSQVCDGFDDCGDWSDEIDCVYKEQRFTCDCFARNRSCTFGVASVPQDQVCDGTFHCSDRSDERGCSCDASKFRCKCAGVGACVGERWCVPLGAVCDGYIDCEDGSDEGNCAYPPRSLFQCACNDSCTSNFRAVDVRQRCDGKNDCGDWSDEEGCGGCAANRFRCDCYASSPITCTRYFGCIDPSLRCDRLDDCGDGSDERGCDFFRCQCGTTATPTLCNALSVAADKRCDLVNDCGDWSDERNCTCPPNSLQCPCNYPGCENGPGCVPFSRDCDGYNDCGDWADEDGCLCPVGTKPCKCYEAVNKTCADKRGCVVDSQVCDGENDCGDWSDELGCQCGVGQVRCGCLFGDANCTSNQRCIDERLVNDGTPDCENGEDEPCVTNSHYCDGYCATRAMYCADSNAKARMLRYENASLTHCYPMMTRTFINDTIGGKEPEWACVSSACNAADHPGCIAPVRCDSDKVIIANAFCDGTADCSDSSDEMYKAVGFKCATRHSTFSCVLPQSNLYDDVPQCSDGADLCFLNGTMNCFQCFDKRFLISRAQVCDGVVDCLDLSDECFCSDQTVCNEVLGASRSLCDPGQLYCNDNLGCVEQSAAVCNGNYKCTNGANTAWCTPGQKNKIQMSCVHVGGQRDATMCDGRPECNDLSDECGNCTNKPWFCDDPCRLYYPIGDRYCDGQKDIAYQFMDDTSCPDGFDEKNCSQRFYCSSGISISIDVNNVCDGKIDCENGEDETKARCADKRFYCLDKKPISVANSQVEDGKWDCADGSDECPPQTDKVTVFSSQYELIGNKLILAVFWIMALVSIAGNIAVFLRTAKDVLSPERQSIHFRYNLLFVLNLSASDFLMGVYLLIVCIKAAQFSGSYCFHDLLWRTSGTCSFLGVLVVISTETSVFIMTSMTAFRLVTMFRPFITSTLRIIWGKLAVAACWILAILIATFPLMFPTSGYFVSGVWFPNYFYKSDQVSKADLNTLAFRMGQTNTSSWSNTKEYIQTKLPYLPIKGDMGYYSETSVCMPRIFVNVGDAGWGYSAFLIGVNLFLFIFMVVGYVLIYRHGTRNTVKAGKRTRQIQGRITRLILTDFACWVPLCTLAFIQLSGVHLPLVVYAISAGILLPTNSAINPLIYSDTISEVFSRLCLCDKRQADNKVIKPASVASDSHKNSSSSGSHQTTPI